MSIVTGNITSTVGNAYVSTGETVVSFMSIANYTAGNVTASVYVVPFGDTAGNLNIVLTNIDIAAEDTYQLYAGNEKLVLGDGDSIQAVANVDNAISTVTSYTGY